MDVTKRNLKVIGSICTELEFMPRVSEGKKEEITPCSEDGGQEIHR